MDILREKGVVRFNDGAGMEVVLGPAPIKKDPKAKDETDPLAARRRHYEVLLNRPVTDLELANLP